MSRVVIGLVFAVLINVHAAPLRPVARAQAGPAAPLADALYTQVTYEGLDDKGADLAGVLEQLSKGHRVTFLINGAAFKAEGLDEPARAPVADPAIPRLERVTLDAVLRTVLQRVPVQSGATLLLRANHIEITTNKAAWREVFGDWAPASSDKKAAPAGRMPVLVHADIRRLPLTQALDLLADRSDRVVTLDGTLDAKKGQTPVTLRLRNTPVDTAALLVAGFAGLQVVEMDNVLFVTTAKKADVMAREYARLRPLRRPTKGP